MRLRSAGEPDEVLAVLGDEAERLAVVELNRGLEATDLVVSLADAAGSARSRSRARRARAKALAYAGRYEEALDHCQTGAGLAEGASLRLEAAHCRLVSMQALGELGRLDDAITEGKTARDAFLGADEPHLAARADANIGTVFQRRGDPTEALEHFDRARSVLSQEPVTAGQLDSNRGEALLALNDFFGAETAFQSALEMFERNRVEWAAAIVEGNLADLATRQGRLERALFYFERARRRLESDAESGHLARLLAEQADAMSVLGLLEDALVGYRQALERLDGCGLALEAARARAGMGTVLLRLGERARAETALAAAAKAFDELGHAAARARVDLMRGELASAQGRRDEARALTQAALVVLKAQPLDGAVCRYHLARLALGDGDPGGAEAQLAEALPAARLLDVAPLMADLLHARALARRNQNKLTDAVSDLEEAVEQIERVRGSLQAARFRAAYLTNRLAVYQDLVTTVLDEDAPQALAKAFHGAERAKSRSLLDLMSGAVALADPPEKGPSDPAEAELAGELARLRAEVNALYSKLSERCDGTMPPGVWRQALRDRERELEDVEARLSTTRGVAGLYAPPVDLETARSFVPADAAIIEYFIAGDELLAFVVRGSQAGVYRRLGTRDELAERVRRFQFQINRALRPGALESRRGERLTRDARSALGELYDMVLAPLRDVVSAASRLFIVPHGPLHVVPFSALWDGGRHLVESHEVHTTPSASLLVHAARRSQRGPGADTAVVVGVADEAAPRIAAEARRVAGILGDVPVLVGAEATADRVTEAARDARIVHLACHGRFSIESPLGSGLKLADRWLTVRDIYPMRLAADLVVLSGCETGRNLVTAGDELVGLLRGFFAAGARSLMASLWRVNDESTTELMCGFYDSWREKGGDGAALCGALRTAQLAIMEDRPHPAFWAPFILVGQP